MRLCSRLVLLSHYACTNMNKVSAYLASAWKRTKAYAFAFAAALGFCSAAHAEGSSTGTAYDIGFVTETANNLSATLTQFWTDNKAAIGSILGIIVTLTLVWLIVRLFKKTTNKAG